MIIWFGCIGLFLAGGDFFKLVPPLTIWELDGEMFQWFDRHPSFAAWGQTLGAMGAIAVAIWVSSGQRREQLKSERNKVRLECQVLRMLSVRACEAVGSRACERPLSEMVRMISGLTLSFNKIDLMSLPSAELVEPVCAIQDALESIGDAIRLARSIPDYLQSSNYSGSVDLISMASAKIEEEIRGLT